jgi:serine/threonine protein kinase
VIAMVTFHYVASFITSRPTLPYQYQIEERLQAALPFLSKVEIETLCDFLTSMLQVDPGMRATMDTISRHKWLSESSYDTMLSDQTCIYTRYL